MSNKEESPCLKFACAIQDCLQKNDFQESKCKSQLAALDNCCKSLLAQGGKSVCCPERKYKNMQNDKDSQQS
ncbi:hypothetical protein BDF20DRAFT_889787 [Mycotypha africana]|uniref:uncharacterized protein n=1 Tax=Mycotypha africana TaxID=64632 RepID=UPI0023005BE0|nr:uncharacterized protein BDF20DRAFT_889787 [Mycotypha africana]KAI8970189.1 hypothetical protein BDF20DRAFT_889787 [Mycotypha africana]